MDLISINQDGVPVLDFYAMFAKMKAETGRDPYGWDLGHDGHYERWKASRGYVKSDQESIRDWYKKVENQNGIWHQEYIAAPDGEITLPKYLNFWHIWTQWVCQKSFENSDPPPQVNFMNFLSRLTAANGVIPEKHEFYREMVRKAVADKDELQQISTIRSYEASFKLDYELEWAIDIVRMIMSWIGPEYHDTMLLVDYDKDYD